MGNRVYDLLFSLTDYDNSKLNDCVRKILLILPSDPRILQKVEAISPG